MNTKIQTLIENGNDVWNNAATKDLWKYFTDDMYSCSVIKEILQETEKETRIEAQKCARIEFVEWVREYVEQHPQAHESDVKNKFTLRYWNRVAELAGITTEQIESRRSLA